MSTGVAGAMVGRALRQRVLFVLSIALGFFAGGILLSSVEWQRAWRPPLRIVFEDLARAERAQAAAERRRSPEDDEAFALVEGVLRADAAASPAGVSLSVAVDGIVRRDGQDEQHRQDGQDRRSAKALAERAAGGILVTVVGSLAAERMDDWRAGRRIRLPVMLRRPSRYLNPGVPDHERAVARRGTTLVGTVKSGALVEVLARGTRVDEMFASARAFARRAIRDAVSRWNAQSGAIVAAIVIGDRAGLDDDVEQRLQEAGTYHVIAISGGNIAILAGILIFAFRTAGWLGRISMWSAIVVLLAYARLVGGGASVDRATLMAIVYFGARAFDQRSPPLNALALVAGLLVATDPLSIADPAFVLTVGATLAILLVVPVVAVRQMPWWAAQAVAILAASAASEAALLPVGAMAFSRITFAGLALNFVAIPLMAVAQLAGMAVVPLAAASPDAASLVGWVAHMGAVGLVRSADLVRVVPVLSYRVAPPAWLVIVLYYAAVCAWWALWRRRVEGVGRAETSSTRTVRRALAAIAAATALWMVVDPRSIVRQRGDGRLHVTFLDVGQGDAMFVVFPAGSTMVVDAGGLSSSSSFDIGDRVVAPVIRDAGFRRVDVVALSHGDPDHIGGAASILGEFRPREVWEGIPVPRSETLTALRTQAQADGARWANVYAADHRFVDGVAIVARHPSVADWERQKVRNDDSMVLELRWRDVSVLLTGDIGTVPERAIAPTIPPSRLRVVKIPHHGSLTSSSRDFVNAIHPQIAIVSAGRSNHFGHPVPEVLDRYRAAGAEVFRTDRDGAVTVDTDGASIAVHTFTGRQVSLK